MGKYPARANTLSDSSTTVEYERIVADVTRKTALYFSGRGHRKYRTGQER